MMMASNSQFNVQQAKTVWRNVAVAVFAVCFALLALCVTVLPTLAADTASRITKVTSLGTYLMGEYPQTYVGDELNGELSAALATGADTLTRCYTADGEPQIFTTDVNSKKVELPVYTYAEQKYAYLHFADATDLINGITFTTNDVITTSADNTTGYDYWFCVEPIAWDVFQTADGIMVAVVKNLLGSMVYDSEGNGVGTNFWENSAHYAFLNGEFIKEAGLTELATERSYYRTTRTNDAAGAVIVSKIWEPSWSELSLFYPSQTARVKITTDFTRATYAYRTAAEMATAKNAKWADTYFVRNYCTKETSTSSHQTTVGSGSDRHTSTVVTTTTTYYFNRVTNGAMTSSGSAGVDYGDNCILPAFYFPAEKLVDLIGERDVVTTYSGTDRQISKLPVAEQPSWYTSTMSLAYYQDGEEVTSVVNAGTYTVRLRGQDFDLATLTVNPKVLSLSGLKVEDKTYDRTTKVTFIEDEVNKLDVIGNDDVEVKWSGSFADKNVGTEKPIVVTATLEGNDAANYVLDTPEFTLYATIKPQTVHVINVAVKDKEYDGTTRAILDTKELKFTGMLDGDDLTVAVNANYSQADVDKNLTVTLEYEKLLGDDAGNYLLSKEESIKEVTDCSINPRKVTFTIDDLAVKVGDPFKPLTARITSGSVIDKDRDIKLYTLELELKEGDDIDNLQPGKYFIKGTPVEGVVNYDVVIANGGYGEYRVLTTEEWDALQTKEEPKEDNNFWLIIIIVIAVAAFVGALVGIGLVIRSHDKNRDNKPKKEKKDKKNKDKTENPTATADAKAVTDDKANAGKTAAKK